LRSETRHIVLPLCALGLGFRAIFISDVSIYEDDWARYLWDGSVTHSLETPYATPPADILNDQNHPLFPDSSEGADVLRLVNNSELSTIYPPAAQAVFALSHAISPYSLDGLRLTFLASDLLAVLLMIGALKAWGRSPLWALLYAFNPLLIVTGFNSAHMDVLLTPFLMGAVWACAPPQDGQSRSLWRACLTSICLALACGVKIWPLVLAPVALRPWRDRPALYIGAGLLCGVLSLIILAPMWVELSDSSGLSAYSQGWLNSSFLFPLIEGAFALVSDNPGRLARMFVALCVGALSVALALSSPTDRDVPTDLLIITAALLFLSPTGYPWYGIWIIALLPFRPFAGLALLTVLTPLYYARFALGEAGTYALYTHVLTPLQYGLPLFVLLVAWLWRQRTA